MNYVTANEQNCYGCRTIADILLFSVVGADDWSKQSTWIGQLPKQSITSCDLAGMTPTALSLASYNIRDN